MNEWKDEDFIPERVLERLRLGELSDDETQTLLDELEARGEMHRLEALIEEDEEIRAHYPPAVMASHARERLRRRGREKRGRSSAGRRAPSLAFALSLVALVIGGVAYLALSPGPAQKTDLGAASPSVAPQKVETSEVETSEVETSEVETSEVEPWQSMWHEFVWMQNEADPNTNPVFACISGESHNLAARDVTRVTTDSADRLTFESNRDVLRMSCDGQGSSIATFHRADEAPRSVTVRIGAKYEAEVPEPACEVEGPAEVRVLVDKRGASDKVLVAGRIEEETSQCLRAWFRQQRWEKGDEPWRVLVWTN